MGIKGQTRDNIISYILYILSHYHIYTVYIAIVPPHVIQKAILQNSVSDSEV